MALVDYIENTKNRTLQEILIKIIEQENQNVLDIAKTDLVRTYKKAESTERSRSAVFNLDESVLI